MEILVATVSVAKAHCRVETHAAWSPPISSGASVVRLPPTRSQDEIDGGLTGGSPAVCTCAEMYGGATGGGGGSTFLEMWPWC